MTLFCLRLSSGASEKFSVMEWMAFTENHPNGQQAMQSRLCKAGKAHVLNAHSGDPRELSSVAALYSICNLCKPLTPQQLTTVEWPVGWPVEPGLFR